MADEQLTYHVAMMTGRGFGKTVAAKQAELFHREAGEPQRFVIQPDSDGSYTARKPGVYGIEVADGFVPLAEVKEQPGKPLPNRKERREWARQAARQLNRQRRRRVVAVQPGNCETTEA